MLDKGQFQPAPKGLAAGQSWASEWCWLGLWESRFKKGKKNAAQLSSDVSWPRWATLAVWCLPGSSRTVRWYRPVLTALLPKEDAGGRQAQQKRAGLKAQENWEAARWL